MNVVRTIGEALLVTVLFVAAVGKLRSRASRDEVTTLARLIGMPERIVAITPIALLAVEFGIAIMLVYPPAARWGGVAATMLMAVLTVAAERARRSPERPACRCFGGAAEPIGRRHVARNAALTGIAALTAVLTFVPAGSPLSVNGVIASVLAGVLLATVVIHLDTLLFLCGLQPAVAPASQGR
jgi:Methylamine utilisation protein MauE